MLLGGMQQSGNEGEMVAASQATQTPTSPESETMMIGDGLDEQTKSACGVVFVWSGV